LLIRLRKQLFAYQTFMRARTAPTVKALLSETFNHSEQLRHDTESVNGREGTTVSRAASQ
jgi:hypothetical protein